jgi:biopolymer transport protein ExbD
MSIRKERQMARINITPLCDVSFTILITLMLATAILHLKPPPFQVILPLAKTVEPRGAEMVTIDISEDGKNIAVQGEPVSWENYIYFIRKEAERDPTRLLLIRADKDIPHGIVLRVLDDLKKLSSEFAIEDKEFFYKVAFGTRKKE